MHLCFEPIPAVNFARSQLGAEVVLCGWVDRIRDHKGVIFIDLRDRWGRTQVVIGPESPAGTLEAAKVVRPEWVIRVRGAVGARPAGTTNPKLVTGEVEVVCRELDVLNEAETPVFQPGRHGTSRRGGPPPAPLARPPDVPRCRRTYSCGAGW